MSSTRKLTSRSWVIGFSRKIEHDIKKISNLFSPINYTLLFGKKLKSGKKFVVVDSYPYGENKIENYFLVKRIDAKIIPFVADDQNKNIDNFIQIINSVNDFQIDRRSWPIIARERRMKKLHIPYKYKLLEENILCEDVIGKAYHPDRKQQIPLSHLIESCIFVDDMTKAEIKNTCKIIGEM
ncbi:MAG: hypothetical protein Q8R43_02470 [Alphaproteobacteria bacterium]|nr:hypothetical protein [Alphaproteobacteria bacterium]